jgi:hypothetical protein
MRTSIVEGPAGTGKTVLALEYARRSAGVNRRVLLLCFNRLLGDWFTAESCALGKPQFRGTSFFRFVRNLILESTYRDEFLGDEKLASSSEVFMELFPTYGQLAAEESGPQFDMLVIDEAQDLIDAQTLDLLGTLLKGGVAGGAWCIFGDFTRQAIYGTAPKEKRLGLLTDRCQHFSRAKLVTNCRNTRRIGEETALLSGFPSPPYRLAQVAGLPVDYRYWRTPEEQLETLTTLVHSLLRDGVRPEDLVILSPNSIADSVAGRLKLADERHGLVAVRELREMERTSANRPVLGFATIQAFKGMESPAVILCDIDRVETDSPQAILYIAMSRARSYLGMLLHESVRTSISRALLKRLEKEWQS